MEEENLYQLYDTDAWGSHLSRTNLGVFSSIEKALLSIVHNPLTSEADTDRLMAIFTQDNRLCIEKITLNAVEGYSQVFDSDKDDDLDLFKKIIFFESTRRYQDDFMRDDIETFDINSIKSVDDVTDDLIEIYLGENKNSISFIKSNFID